MCLLLPLGMRRVRRSMPRGLLSALLLAGATTMLAGCGCGGGFAVQPRSYTLTVTGTSGSVQHSTTVTLVVK